MKFKLNISGDQKPAPEPEVEITFGLRKNLDGSVTLTSARSDDSIDPVPTLTIKNDGTIMRHIYSMSSLLNRFFQYEKTAQNWDTIKIVDEQWYYSNH